MKIKVVSKEEAVMAILDNRLAYRVNTNYETVTNVAEIAVGNLNIEDGNSFYFEVVEE